MKIITFNGNYFNPKNVQGPVTCPTEIRDKMVKEILPDCPKDSDVKEFTFSTAISYGPKKVMVSVWQFDLKAWPGGKPFNYFYKDGSEIVIVYCIRFFNDGVRVYDAGDWAATSCALGYPKAEWRRAMFMLGTKAAQFAASMKQDVRDFFGEKNDLIELIASKLPEGSTIKKDDVKLVGKVPVKEYDVRVSFYIPGNTFTAIIPHKYSEGELVYGDKFEDYRNSVTFNTPEEVEAFDWDAFWDDLYKNKYGRLVWHGSLGT